MNVDAIITHLENFQDTWEGWHDFLGGLVDFFKDNPIAQLRDYFTETDNDGKVVANSRFTDLSSK